MLSNFRRFSSLTFVRLLFVSLGVLVGHLDREDDDGRQVVGQRLVHADLAAAGIDAEGRSVVVRCLA